MAPAQLVGWMEIKQLSVMMIKGMSLFVWRGKVVIIAGRGSGLSTVSEMNCMSTCTYIEFSAALPFLFTLYHAMQTIRPKDEQDDSTSTLSSNPDVPKSAKRRCISSACPP